MKLIGILNHKGGTGKTTTSANVGHYLSMKGNKVLICDLDTQGNIRHTFGIYPEDGINTFDLFLREKCSIDECIVNSIPTRNDFWNRIPEKATVSIDDTGEKRILLSDFIKINRKNLDLMISDDNLSKASSYIDSETGKETYLKRKLQILNTLPEPYDYVLFDCSPTINIFNHNVLTCVDFLIVPVTLEYLAGIGLSQVIMTINTINEFFRNTNPLGINLIVPTKLNEVTSQAKEVYNMIKEAFPENIIAPAIHDSVRVGESPSFQMTVFEYYAYLKATGDGRARSMKRIVEEFIALGEKVLEQIYG